MRKLTIFIQEIDLGTRAKLDLSAYELRIMIKNNGIKEHTITNYKNELLRLCNSLLLDCINNEAYYCDNAHYLLMQSTKKDSYIFFTIRSGETVLYGCISWDTNYPYNELSVYSEAIYSLLDRYNP